MAGTDWDALVAENRAALIAIANGDGGPYKALYSDADDITLGNPFGGFGRGRAAVFEQIDRAASYYRDGEPPQFETVAEAVGTDLAYTVEIERFRVKVAGDKELSQVALRVTCVYRLESTGWRLLHRHADPRVDRQTAESVIADGRPA
jgi:ketosteroid isomerase-like protein